MVLAPTGISRVQDVVLTNSAAPAASMTPAPYPTPDPSYHRLQLRQHLFSQRFRVADRALDGHRQVQPIGYVDDLGFIKAFARVAGENMKSSMGAALLVPVPATP